MVQVQVGKEFPDMRQNEREMKFIRVRDAVRTTGPAKPRNKNSRLHLPDLREEVREKARGGGKRSPVELRGMGREPGTWC